jgi:hypothetical protein
LLPDDDPGDFVFDCLSLLVELFDFLIVHGPSFSVSPGAHLSPGVQVNPNTG